MKRRFEEVLEECLAAQLEGRRSVEDSLSLYPSLSAELEPLLRTAESVSSAFESLNPPANLIESGRARFVAASSENRRARAIASEVEGLGRSRFPWDFRRWGMLGTAVTAGVGLLLIGAVVLIAGLNGGSEDSVFNPPGDASPSADTAVFAANFQQFKSRLNTVKLLAIQGRVGPNDLASLREATSELAGGGQPPDEESRQAVEEALNEQYALVFELAGDLSPEHVPEVQEVLITTQKVAKDLGVAISPDGTPGPSGEPLPTETPGATPGASETPAPTPPATQTPAPSATPTPTPSAP